jgi:hypothetical protein
MSSSPLCPGNGGKADIAAIAMGIMGSRLRSWTYLVTSEQVQPMAVGDRRYLLAGAFTCTPRCVGATGPRESLSGGLWQEYSAQLCRIFRSILEKDTYMKSKSQ